MKQAASGRTLVTVCILCGASFPLAAVAEDCTRWNVPAGYTLNQDNGYRVKLLNGLSGRAQYWPASTRSPVVNGDVFGGLVSGSKLSFKVNWQNGASGSYDGDITRNGYVRGVTRDQKTGAAAGFVGAILKCAAMTPPPPQQSSGSQKPRPPIITRQPDVIRKPDGDVR
jgi:hypothetical protein